jgi:histidine ammonia-lyase
MAMTDNLRGIIAIELLAAAQGCDFHPMKSSERLEAVRAKIRAVVPHLDEDRYFAPDIESAISLLREAAFETANLPGVT